ncbi:MAG: hypothetical protein FD124_2642 [Alphaproteobacteria bacterium]|nr:MAG: hypothetical protein FD124_2642 [Alphaproteobacteria bacterium]
MRGEPAAERGPEDEAAAERRAHHAERGRALFRRRDIGDVGAGGGGARGRDARENARGEHHREVRREREHHVLQTDAEIREENDRPAPETIRQRPEHG